MRTSIKTTPTTLMKLLALLSVTGAVFCSNAFAQSAQQRPAPSNNQVNGSFFGGAAQVPQERTNPPVTAPGSGIAVDGGTAGVVVNNYNSNNNTVTVNK